MTITKCSYCGFSYDEWQGDTRNGVPPGVPFSELAGSICSRCGIQGIRHQRQPNLQYKGIEAEYYDQFAGKAGIASYKDWVMEEKFKANILEIGVGTARIALDICQAGIPVTGVDCSSDMLAIAEKKKKQMLKEDPNLLQLVEQDILQLNLGKKYSHILLTDGFLQHFTLLDEHRSILAKVKEHLAEDGWLAIDLVLPPSQSKWSFTDRKRLTDQKHLYKQVEGETSLQRQLFRYKVTYEMFNDHVEELRYRVERELALILSRELALLLESEGFQVRCIQENYGNTSQHSWKEIYDKNTELPTPYLDLQESLEGLDDLGSALPYQHLAWGNGGYPFSETLPQREAGSPTRFTLLSKLK